MALLTPKKKLKQLHRGFMITFTSAFSKLAGLTLMTVALAGAAQLGQRWNSQANPEPVKIGYIVAENGPVETAEGHLSHTLLGDYILKRDNMAGLYLENEQVKSIHFEGEGGVHYGYRTYLPVAIIGFLGLISLFQSRAIGRNRVVIVTKQSEQAMSQGQSMSKPISTT